MREGDCSCGIPACPSAGKHPRTRNGVKDATTDPEQIRRWWRQWPDANLGVATGNGLYVIDIDCNKGGEYTSLEDCDLEHLACTLTAKTGSGGYHLYLSYDPRLKLPNTSNKLGPFIDTRGEGGYVVAPPSCNRYGTYRWDAKNPVEPVTAELLAKLTSQSKEQEGTHHALSHQAQAPAAAARSAAHQSVAEEGRNNHLIRVAGKLRYDGFTTDEIRGSTGITGAADTSMVLKRARNQPSGSLHLTGRTIAEQELALTLSVETGLWTCTGSTAERQVSQSKQEILDLLEGNEAMSPKEIAEALEKPQNTIKSALSRMVQDGLLARSGRGCYTLPLASPTLFDQAADYRERPSIVKS